MGATRPFRQPVKCGAARIASRMGRLAPPNAGPCPGQTVSAGWLPFRCRMTSATSAISCSRSRWCSSSLRSHSSRLGKRRWPRRRRWCPCRCMCSPPFLVSPEELADRLLCLSERLRPAVEQVPALGRQFVGALRRARQLGAPLGADEALVLEAAQEPVEVADVDSPLPQLRDPLEQLIAVQRALAQEQQKRGLDEAFYASADVPMTRPDQPAAAGPRMAVVSHLRPV